MIIQLKTPHPRLFPAPLLSAHNSGERMLPPQICVNNSISIGYINYLKFSRPVADSFRVGEGGFFFARKLKS